MIKKYIFLVTLAGGMTFTQAGEGRNIDAALMDACAQLAESGEYPEDDIMDVELKQEEQL